MSTSALFADARDRLAGLPREQLGELVEPRRVLGVRRAPRIAPRDQAWHLGVLLVADDPAAGARIALALAKASVATRERASTCSEAFLIQRWRGSSSGKVS